MQLASKSLISHAKSLYSYKLAAGPTRMLPKPHERTRGNARTRATQLEVHRRRERPVPCRHGCRQIGHVSCRLSQGCTQMAWKACPQGKTCCLESASWSRQTAHWPSCLCITGIQSRLGGAGIHSFNFFDASPSTEAKASFACKKPSSALLKAHVRTTTPVPLKRSRIFRNHGLRILSRVQLQTQNSPVKLPGLLLRNRMGVIIL